MSWLGNNNQMQPNFYNQNPYFSQAPYIPQMQPTMKQAPTLFGRFVNSIDEITLNEVPMDGSIAVFPQNDYSCIYLRTWSNQGELKTLKFIPEVVNENQNKIDKETEMQTAILQKLDNLENLLQRKQYNQNNGNKKGE